MPVIDAKEDDGARSATLGTDGLTGRRRWTVRCSLATDGPLVAMRASGVPRIGDSYPGEGALLCVRLEPNSIGTSRTFFEVLIHYATNTGTGGSLTGNPLDEPADVEWDAAAEVMPIDRDLNGNPIVNVLGESFDPPRTAEVDDPVLIITRNQASFDPDTIRIYKGSVNADTFYGAQPGRAKIIRINTRRYMTGTTVAYWKVTYAIQFKFVIPADVLPAEAWYDRVLNQSRKARASPGAAPLPILEGGQQIADPVTLKLDGTRAAEGVGVWLSFPRCPVVAFAPLGLE